MPPKPKRKCEAHGKAIYRSVPHATGDLVRLSKQAGTARLYWEPRCNCYHITKTTERLEPRDDDS